MILIISGPVPDVRCIRERWTDSEKETDMPEICSSSTPLLHRWLSDTCSSCLLILACSCCPNLPFTNFQKKWHPTRPEASHARRGCCFPLQQQLSKWMQTRPLHSAPSFHIMTIFFLMRNVFRPPLTLSPTGNSAHTHTHARKLLYKTFGRDVWTILQKNTKKLLQLQTACLSFSHSAPHICMKTIHR